MTIDEFIETVAEIPATYVRWYLEEDYIGAALAVCRPDELDTVITAVADWVLRDSYTDSSEYVAAKHLGLSEDVAIKIQDAVSNSFGHDADLRQKILKATGLDKKK